MAKYNDGLTQRQRQSQQIMREKVAKKKRKALVRKLSIIAGSALSVVLLGGGMWAWKSGAAVRAAQDMVDGTYMMSGKAGFTVQALYLEGRNRTSMDDIKQALGVKKGDPILRVSLADIRKRLESIESVKFAAVERDLPDTLHVRIVEREPVALWQHNGKLAPVDDNGVVMNGLDSMPYRHLPLIVGDDAPAHVAELMNILSSDMHLSERFVAAVHVGERRWNIRVNGPEGKDIDIKLPENDPVGAWRRLAVLEAKQQVLDRDVKMIDLRLPDRLFMQLPPQGKGKSNGARET